MSSSSVQTRIRFPGSFPRCKVCPTFSAMIFQQINQSINWSTITSMNNVRVSYNIYFSRGTMLNYYYFEHYYLYT
jgi:hypothetical protein